MKVQEIFNSDLDPNSSAWWSNEKIDKINYNFAMMSNGGPVGPIGFLGLDGIVGDDGTGGPVGFQGIQGVVGPQGPVALRLWKKVQSGDFVSIFPRDRGEDPSNLSYSPPSLKMGMDIGVYSTTGSSDEVIIKPGVLKINSLDDSGSNSRKNIKVTYAGTANAYTTIKYDTLTQPAGKGIRMTSELSTGVRRPFKFFSNFTNLIAQTNDSTTVPATAGLKINNSNIQIETSHNSAGFTATMDTSAGTPTLEFNKELYFENGAGLNKVLVTKDNTGHIEWKDQTEVFQMFPVGTIMQLPVSLYNDTNFHVNYNQEVSTVNNTGDGFIDIRFKIGRGRQTSDWQGWYLCNGKTWTGGTAATQNAFDGTGFPLPVQKVPNLNNVSFEIDLPGNSLGLTDVICIDCIAADGVSTAKYDHILAAETHSSNILYTASTSTFNINTPIPSNVITTMAALVYSNRTARPAGFQFGASNEETSNKIRDGKGSVSIIYLGKKDLFWYHKTPDTY